MNGPENPCPFENKQENIKLFTHEVDPSDNQYKE